MSQLDDALLEGKVVLVSGGTQGLGAAIATAAARNGGAVVVTSRRREAGEQQVAVRRTTVPEMSGNTERAMASSDPGE